MYNDSCSVDSAAAEFQVFVTANLCYVLEFYCFIDEFGGFDWCRCSKTSLKLAVSRIKLLKNKKDAQVKQIKRELAQLLETGQERTARIRVCL